MRESVTEGVTGTFFDRCEPEALAEAVLAFDALAIDPRACRAAAERFGAERFRADAAPDRRRGDARGAARRGPEERLNRGLAGLPGRRQARRGERAA